MEWLILIGIGAALYGLFGRMQRLEDRVADLTFALSQFEPVPHAQGTMDVPESVETEPAQVPDTPTGKNDEVAPDEPVAVEIARADWNPEPDGEARGPSFAWPSLDFEDIFGRRLPIWVGGITLALAGIFLVRFSIERGLLSPPVRVALSFLFGLALLAGAEIAFRFEERVRDPRVRQALAGAGLATLYAGFYLAGTVYGLIGSASAFVGLAVVTAAAIGLSWRFGLPSAVLGLVGGFAAPALVASEDANIPLLTLYLALVAGGLSWTGARQHRAWLGYLALAAGFGWGAVLLLGGLAEGGDLVALGLLITVLGVLVPVLLAGDPHRRITRVLAAAVSSLQMAALVETGGNAMLTWGLYLLLGGALAVLGWRDGRVREGGAVAAGIGLCLLVASDQPSPGEFQAVAAGFAAIFLLVPLALVWRGKARPLDLWQLALAAPGLAAATYWMFGEWDLAAIEPGMAGVAAALALVPALAALRQWRSEGETLLVVPLASAALLAHAALLALAPEWLAPVSAAVVAAALLVLLRTRRSAPLAALAWIAAMIALFWLAITTFDSDAEWARLGGGTTDTHRAQALLRWAAAALPLAGLAALEWRQRARRAAEALAALVTYGLLAQVLPGDWLAWMAALGAIGVALGRRERGAAAWALGAIAALWALAPLAEWVVDGLNALVGEPMLIAEDLGFHEALLRLTPPAAAAAAGWWALDRSGRIHERLTLSWVASVLGVVTLHVLFKQALALDDVQGFRHLGLAERTVWQALLAATGLALLRMGRRSETLGSVGRAVIALSFAHFVVFTLVLHNPLLVRQAVGPVPIANWLLAYGVALLGIVVLKRELPERVAVARPAFDAVVVALISMFALSTLRHAFAGSMMAAAPLSQGEDLLRSLLGIVLALGFLWLGARTGQRSWRIGSLVLILLAVFKVFLIDTAGLEGLLRIASFMALGFSLIGIGWVYSRQLARRPAGAA